MHLVDKDCPDPQMHDVDAVAFQAWPSCQTKTKCEDFMFHWLLAAGVARRLIQNGRGGRIGFLGGCTRTKLYHGFEFPGNAALAANLLTSSQAPHHRHEESLLQYEGHA